MTINNACYEDKDSCFAYSCGICLALHSTDELRKPCPFFKTKRQNKDERKKVILKLLEKDRIDLILTYTCSGSKTEAKSVLTELGLYDVYMKRIEPFFVSGGKKSGTKESRAAQRRYQKKKREKKKQKGNEK